MSRFEFVIVRVWADRPCNDLATSQSAGRVGVATRVWSVSNCFHDPAGQSQFFGPVSRIHKFSLLHWPVQTANSIVVSVIAISRLVDNLQTWQDCPKSGGPRKVKGKDNLQRSRHQIVHRPNYKLKPFANSNRGTGELQVKPTNHTQPLSTFPAARSDHRSFGSNGPHFANSFRLLS